LLSGLALCIPASAGMWRTGCLQPWWRAGRPWHPSRRQFSPRRTKAMTPPYRSPSS